jgi:hypothetical protein
MFKRMFLTTSLVSLSILCGEIISVAGVCASNAQEKTRTPEIVEADIRLIENIPDNQRTRFHKFSLIKLRKEAQALGIYASQPVPSSSCALLSSGALPLGTISEPVSAFMPNKNASKSLDMLLTEISLIESIPEHQRIRSHKSTLIKLRKEAKALGVCTSQTVPSSSCVPLITGALPLKTVSEPVSALMPNKNASKSLDMLLTEITLIESIPEHQRTRFHKSTLIKLRKDVKTLDKGSSSLLLLQESSSDEESIKTPQLRVVTLSSGLSQRPTSFSSQEAAQKDPIMTFAIHGGPPWVQSFLSRHHQNSMQVSSDSSCVFEEGSIDASVQRLNAVVLMMGGSLSMFSRKNISGNYQQYLNDLKNVEEAARVNEVADFKAKKAIIEHLQVSPFLSDKLLYQDGVSVSERPPKPTGKPPKPTAKRLALATSSQRQDSQISPLPVTTQSRALSTVDRPNARELVINGPNSDRDLAVRPEKDLWDHIKDFFVSLGSCFMSRNVDDKEEGHAHEKRPLLTQEYEWDETWSRPEQGATFTHSEVRTDKNGQSRMFTVIVRDIDPKASTKTRILDSDEEQ